jgi:hypothetical protein
MSIIYEALKKIEAEKKDDSPDSAPIVFALPKEETTGDERPKAFRHAVRYAAIAFPLLFLLALLIKPDSFRLPSSRPSPPVAHTSAAPSIAPVIKEVRLQPRDILPSTINLSLKPQELPTPAVQKGSASVTDTKIPELRLKGISQSGDRSWAFVNDRMLKVGDTIEGAEVLDILKDRVKLKYSGMEFTLSY